MLAEVLVGEGKLPVNEEAESHNYLILFIKKNGAEGENQYLPCHINKLLRLQHQFVSINLVRSGCTLAHQMHTKRAIFYGLGGKL
jgi:hypothetical protein